MAERTKTWLDRGKDALRTTTALIAIGGIGVAAAGCTTEAKPPATGPAVPGDTDPNKPSPSEGNPPASPENPGDNETDPLAPENLWAASEQERLEAVRIPEGTSPEDYPAERSERREALLNAGASKKAFREWESNEDKNGVTLNDCSKYIYNKLAPAFEQLDGGPLNKNGPERWALTRACAMNAAEDSVPYFKGFMPKITETAEVISVSGKDVKYKYTIRDNVTNQYADDYKYFKGGNSILKMKDGGFIMNVGGTIVAKNVGYNEKEKTIQPSDRDYPTA